LELDHRPVQHKPPPPLIMNKRDMALTQTEIEKMVTKGANFSGSQEGWVSKTSGELEGHKQVHHMQEVQDGRGSSLEGPFVPRGLDGINRPKGRLLLCDHGPTRLEIAPVQLARSDLRVPNLASGVGPPSDIVSGRHVADGSVKGRVKVVHEVSPTTPAAVRIQHQLGQICSLPYAEDSVPRIYGKFSGDVHIASKGESDQVSQACRAMLSQPSTTVQKLSRMVGHLTATVQAILPAPLCLPPASAAKERGIPDISLILNKSCSGTRSLAGSAVVEGSS